MDVYIFIGLYALSMTSAIMIINKATLYIQAQTHIPPIYIIII